MKKAISILCCILMSGLLMGQEMVSSKDISVPYMMKAPAPITVDGVLDEWAFAYPIRHNSASIPDTSRFRVELGSNLPESDDDMSGDIYMMWDEFALYFAAHVRDDNPGYTSDTQWASDAIEIYFCNWDIGNALSPEAPVSQDNDTTGQYYLQFNIAFNALLDSTAIYAYGPFGTTIETENTNMAYTIWPDEDGYTLEGQIDWLDVESPNTGNSLMPQAGSRIGITWSMYDIDPGDEVDGGTNFDGWAYTPLGFAGWMGPSEGFQAIDVLDTPRGTPWEDDAVFDFVTPYIKKVAANRPVTVDGDLTDWNFAFPTDHFLEAIPDSGRFPNELGNNYPTFDEDLKGTIYMQHDNDNGFIYFAASVQDNFPGWLSDVVNWQGDVVELYLNNWDIGDVLLPENVGNLNDSLGNYSVQFNAGFDALRDSTKILAFNEFNTNIATPTTFLDYSVWPNEDGYDIEGQIDIFDIESPSTGNLMEWTVGERVAITWSLYDLDTTTVNESWKGMAYTPKGFAAWMGVGPGFQYSDIKSYSLVEAIDLVRTGSLTIDVPVGIEEDTPVIAGGFDLHQNYPNPFNPSTTMSFTLDQRTDASLKVYNILGQLVFTVFDNENLSAGTHYRQVDFSSLASGMYISVLQSKTQTSTIKMMLLK